MREPRLIVAFHPITILRRTYNVVRADAQLLAPGRHCLLLQVTELGDPGIGKALPLQG